MDVSPYFSRIRNKTGIFFLHGAHKLLAICIYHNNGQQNFCFDYEQKDLIVNM